MHRNGLIDIYRFIAVMIIVADHVGYLGVEGFPCARRGWHVFFFLVLTGVLTRSHFSCDDNLWEAMKHKFVRFLPYTALSVIVGNILLWHQNISLQQRIGRAFYSIFEICLLGEIPLLGKSHVIGPLWMLSAMLLCFPIVWLLIKKMNNIEPYVYIVYCSVIGLGRLSVSGDFPIKLLYVLASIMIGCIISDIVVLVDKYTLNRRCLFYFVGAGGILAFVVTVYICYFCIADYPAFQVMSIISIIFTMSKAGNIIKGNMITNFLGREMSMIIYITHINSVFFVQRYFFRYSEIDKIRIYFLMVFVFAIVAYIIVNLIGKLKQHIARNQQISIKDAEA